MTRADFRVYEQTILSTHLILSCSGESFLWDNIKTDGAVGDWEAKQQVKLIEFQKKQKAQRDEEETMLRNHHDNQMERFLLALGNLTSFPFLDFLCAYLFE